MLLLMSSLFGLLAFSSAIRCGSITPVTATSTSTFFIVGPTDCNLTFNSPTGLSVTCAINFESESPNCTKDQLKFLGENISVGSGPFCGRDILTATTVSNTITVSFKISSIKRILMCNIRQISTSSTTSTTTKTSTPATIPSTTETSSTPKILPCNSVTNLNSTAVSFKVVGPSWCSFTFNSPTGFDRIYCSMKFTGVSPSSNCTTDQLIFYIGNNFAGGPYCGIWNMTVATGSTSLRFNTNIESSTSYLICSIFPSLISTVTTPATTTTASPTEPTSCSCGIASASRIIGGTDAKQYQFPWQVRLNLFSSESESGNVICGGTLISPNFVLTAAHCLERAIWAKIFLGDSSTAASDTYEVIFNSTNLIKHNGWNSITLANDIALIRLPSPVAFSPGIQPACLPFRYANFSFIGSTCTATGWGRTNDSNGNIATILQQTNITVISNTACADTWPSYILPNMICVQQPGTSTCHGDSGGPLGYNAPTGVDNQDRTYVIGVVSFGNANGCSISPNVFTRVTSFLDWIESTTGEIFCNK